MTARSTPLQRLTRYYPSVRGTGVLAAVADVLRRATERHSDRTGQCWRLARPSAWNPPLVLDLNIEFQRKVFYFTPAFGRHYLGRVGPILLRHYLRPGGTFIDIGANLGFWTFSAARIVGDTGTVHAFEPEPQAFSSLCESAEVAGHDNVVCHAVALSDAPSESTNFFLSRSGNQHSLLAEVEGRQDRYRSSVMVNVESIDHLIGNKIVPIGAVDFIKVDVEGVEPAVVTGMQSALKEWNFPPLLIEVRGPMGSTRAPNTFREVCARLRPLGYKAFGVAADRQPYSIDVVDVRVWADVLFAVEKPEFQSIPRR